ncbi:hypothetical protein [Rhodovulum kholense]|uniref:hypothetical protein n=1 Tax=Rhodovulum kholense TaxID=453584 RepID=UPI000D3910E8|nr:hypothetical protein [Rhodovulum kholense]
MTGDSRATHAEPDLARVEVNLVPVHREDFGRAQPRATFAFVTSARPIFTRMKRFPCSPAA